jgi:hypothetical protein
MLRLSVLPPTEPPSWSGGKQFISTEFLIPVLHPLVSRMLPDLMNVMVPR